jgi:hypothetical protein
MGLISDGTTIFDAGVLNAGGSMILIKSIVLGANSNTVNFTDGGNAGHGTASTVLDSTYKEYLFLISNMRPTTDNKSLGFQANVSGGSGFDETITSTCFRAFHAEDNSGAAVSYITGNDQAQGTSFQRLTSGINNGAADSCASGYLRLYNPADTTFATHFESRFSYEEQEQSIQVDMFVSGYINTTAAIDEISFYTNGGQVGSGGTFALYGIK